MITNLLIWLVVGLIAGYLASKMLSGRGMGLPADIVVGLLGAVIGGYLAGMAGISLGGGFIGEVVIAFVGAFLLLLVARLVTSRGRFSHS
ncbi:MAG TPA: GlsB/YeaQ/YmgE family stress response membrane protein [Candidatus Dormibacteraeota bacterium]|jgi:uncharacterized membrane protein YeaQ/YmgE (transglycosylase-associated protein family)